MARNLTMMTDFYELTMSQAYFKAGKKDEIAVFDAFFRRNPLNGGYGVMGGVDKIIDFIRILYTVWTTHTPNSATGLSPAECIWTKVSTLPTSPSGNQSQNLNLDGI